MNAARTGNVKRSILSDKWRSEGEVKGIYGSRPFQSRNLAGVRRRTPLHAVPKVNVCREHGNEAAKKQHCQSHSFHERTMQAIECTEVMEVSRFVLFLVRIGCYDAQKLSKRIDGISPSYVSARAAMRGVRILEKTGMWVLLIILIMVASSALIQFVTSPKPAWVEVAQKQQEFRSAEDEKFQSLFHKGSQAFNDGQYTQALSQYDEAERIVPQLNEEQYRSLKDARLQVAALYEAAAKGAESEAVYKGMVESAFRDGAVQLHSGHLDAALVRYQDAEKYSGQVGDAKRVDRIGANEGEVRTLRSMRRYSDAADASRRLIDSLQSSDEYDPGIVQGYMRLGETYQMQRDWNNVEATLTASLAVCDKILAHYAGISDREDPVWKVVVNEDQILYALMDAYEQDKKTDEALATAQALYDFVAQHSTEWNELPLYGRNDVAKAAMRIAARASRPDVVDTWRQRVDPSRH